MEFILTQNNKSKLFFEPSTNFLVLDWRPDQYKNFEPLYVHIGRQIPNLLNFQKSEKYFDVHSSLFL